MVTLGGKGKVLELENNDVYRRTDRQTLRRTTRFQYKPHPTTLLQGVSKQLRIKQKENVSLLKFSNNGVQEKQTHQAQTYAMHSGG
jgi:hypothetical protein